MPSYDPVQELSHPDAVKVRSGLVRGLLRVPAVLSLDIGLLGVVTPGLLTPDFILLAAWAAARSSPRFHVWC